MSPAGASQLRRAAGVSLLEAVVSLLLGLLLMALLLAILGRQRDVVASLERRAETLAALRTSRVVLRREGRALGTEGWGVFTDSVRLRAFRGVATVCPHAGGGAVIVVSPKGVRAADPTKDSVLTLSRDGAVRALALEDATGDASACDPAAGWERWVLSDSVSPGVVLVRYYERGSYHLSGAALRYRRGAAGRQPLTPEALRTPESRFLPSPRSLHALLFPEGTPYAVDLFVGRWAP